MFLHRCEYLQIISFLDSKMPHFLDKYPGYKIILFKLQYFNMIIQEKSKSDICTFFNKELLPLLQKYNLNVFEDYLEFLENPIIIKSRSYQQIWEKACIIFQTGFSLSLDWILWVEKEKNKKNNSKNKVINYYKEKENFAKEINTLINFEQEIINNYKSNEYNKFHNLSLYGVEQGNNLDIFNEMNHGFAFNNIGETPPVNFNFLKPNELVNFNDFSPKNKSFNNDINNVIFENKNDFIKCNFYNDLNNNNLKINNLNLINFKEDENNNSKNNNLKNNNSDSISLNTNPVGNKRNSKVSINSRGSTKSYKSDIRKKKIKEYKFKQLKRENIDKKILRKFKKYLKAKSKDKKDNEIKNYIKNNDFWSEYIKQNLMPPFKYEKEKEKVSFKSFNTQYLCWFFEHKYSLELFNFFIKENYDNLIHEIKEANNLKENCDDFSLIKNYINTMPLIYGKENQNRSTDCSSNPKPIDDEINEIGEMNKMSGFNNQANIEDDKKIENNVNNNDNMIIENENENEFFNNNNNSNIDNNISYLNNANNINNINNDFQNLQKYIFGTNSNINIEPNNNENENMNENMNENENENEMNNSFEF